MKRIYLLLLSVFIVLFSCKKDQVDATTTKTFQSSINDMASSLSTLEQVKFNEALYILKTFGVSGENDIQKLSDLGKLINGMKVAQIFNLADEVARKNGVDWISTGPPSLGEMNIFGNEEAKAYDPNDIKANSLTITTIELDKDSIMGARAIQVIPRLVDATGKSIEFSGAALETILEVYSKGKKLSIAKNLMQDNDFRGFSLKYASLSADKVVDNVIDLTIRVKTTNKEFKMTKLGVPVNPNFLKKQESLQVAQEAHEESVSQIGMEESTQTTQADPQTTVRKFLDHLASQNFKAAYESSDNPNWGSYEAFSNPTSGFGMVKQILVKEITTVGRSAQGASVRATYDITDKSGNTTALEVTFGLKNTNGEWKISNYRIKQ